MSVPGTPYRLVVGTLELPLKALRRASRLARRNRERGVSRSGSKATIPLR